MGGWDRIEKLQLGTLHIWENTLWKLPLGKKILRKIRNIVKICFLYSHLFSLQFINIYEQPLETWFFSKMQFDHEVHIKQNRYKMIFEYLRMLSNVASSSVIETSCLDFLKNLFIVFTLSSCTLYRGNNKHWTQLYFSIFDWSGNKSCANHDKTISL